MTPDAIQIEEYRAVTAAIRERTTVRVLAVVVAWVGWAALALTIMLVVPAPLLLLVPLVLLLAGFEANLKIVRTTDLMAAYLRVTFEEGRGVASWETVSASLERRGRATRDDPLFFWAFMAFIAASYLCVVLASGETAEATARNRQDAIDLALVTSVHLAVAARFAMARRWLRGVRGADRDRVRAS
jgi:uncharacterized membrane protein